MLIADMQKENGMYLYIMRHGQTDDNTRRVLQGKKDNPLNEQGRRQAREAGKKLAGIVFDKVYTSPLKRAVETALLATGKNISDIIMEDKIIEIGFGVLEGTCYNDLKPPYDNFFKNPACYEAPEGGESLQELTERTMAFLEEIKGTLPEKNVLLVSHGAAIHSIVYQLKRQTIDHLWDMSLSNCGILEVSDESGEYKIIREDGSRG